MVKLSNTAPTSHALIKVTHVPPRLAHQPITYMLKQLANDRMYHGSATDVYAHADHVDDPTKQRNTVRGSPGAYIQGRNTHTHTRKCLMCNTWCDEDTSTLASWTKTMAQCQQPRGWQYPHTRMVCIPTLGRHGDDADRPGPSVAGVVVCKTRRGSPELTK